MRNYWITMKDAGDNAADVLKASNIDSYLLDLQGTSGIVVEDAKITEALNVLALASVEDFATEYDGLLGLVVRPGDPKAEPIAVVEAPKTKAKKPVSDNHTVTISPGSLIDVTAPDKVKDIVTKELLRVVGKNIIIDVPHSKSIPTLLGDKTTFYIHVWSRLGVGIPTAPRPPQLLGTEMLVTDLIYTPTGMGQVIDDGFTPVAEIIDNDLFIFADLVHLGTKEELNALTILCSSTALYFLPEDERDAKIKEIDEAKHRARREAFVKACSSTYDGSLRTHRDAVARFVKSAGDHEKAYIKCLRDLQSARDQLNFAEKVEGNKEGAFTTTYEQLRRLPHVVDIATEGGTVVVSTDTLYCVDSRTDKVHKLGRFKLKLGLDHSGIRATNLDHRPGGMNAPHVFAEGNFCMGNVADALPQLLATYEFAPAVALAIEFLQSADIHDSAGKHVNDWPLAEDQEGSRPLHTPSPKKKTKVAEAAAIAEEVIEEDIFAEEAVPVEEED